MAEHDPALVEKARREALSRYDHQAVRDRYDADLLIAGFQDGAAWAAEREPAIREAVLAEVRERIGALGVRNDSAQKWGITTVLHLLDDMAAQQREDDTDGR